MIDIEIEPVKRKFMNNMAILYKGIEARGRNGWFNAKRAIINQPSGSNGMLIFNVYSKKMPTNYAPIALHGSLETMFSFFRKVLCAISCHDYLGSLEQDKKMKYLEKGGVVCPSCGSDQIEGADISIDMGFAIQDMGCLECDFIWADHYALVDMVER